MDKVCWEKSELSSQLETLKVQYGHNHGEMLMQIRKLEVMYSKLSMNWTFPNFEVYNLQCETAKLESKCNALERNIQEALREKEKAMLAFQAAENDEAKLRGNLCALEMKFEKVTDEFKRDLEHKDHIHNLEVQELKKNLHSK